MKKRILKKELLKVKKENAELKLLISLIKKELFV